MSAVGQEPRRIWVVAALAALGVLALFLALFRSPVPPPPAPVGRLKPTVEVPASGELAINDRAVFKDPTPLFLPTRWNSAPPELKRREPEGAFTGYDSKYAFIENDLQLNMPPSIAVPARPVEALVGHAPGNPYLGMGRVDVTVPPLAPRWAFVEIVAAETGRRVFARPLVATAELGERAGTLQAGNWQPVEFMAAVDAAGLVGRLTPVARADSAADDPFFELPGQSLSALENYLAQRLRIGDRLPPGFYRIFVGP